MSNSSESGIGCGCAILVLIFNLTIGAWSVNYITNYFGKDIPLIGDILIGLFVAEISVPVAVVLAILKFFGVDMG